MRDPAREQERERELRFGLDRDPLEEHQHELELTERIAEQASLPTSHPLVVEAVRHRLGRGRSPYEHPHQPEPRRLAAGDQVSHFGPHGPRPGVVVRTVDGAGLVEVEFGHSTTLVAIDEVEPTTGSAEPGGRAGDPPLSAGLKPNSEKRTRFSHRQGEDHELVPGAPTRRDRRRRPHPGTPQQ